MAQLVAGRRLVKGLKGVILIGPAPPTPFELPDDMKKQQMAAYSSYESAGFVARNVLTSSTLSDEMVAILVEDMVKGREFSRLAWPNYAMAEDIVVESRHINVPVLVIAGELDRIEPLDRLKTEVLGNITGVEIVVVAGSGHLIPVEAPEQTAKHVAEFAEKHGT